MNLQHLRDEVPLTEFDYAAVRARVRSEIARRRQRSVWVFRFASAFVAATLAVVALIPVEPLRMPLAIPRSGATGFSPSKPVASLGGLKPAAPQVRIAKARHRKKHIEPEVTAISRIEIHTADPDVRIIWIVPKENS